MAASERTFRDVHAGREFTVFLSDLAATELVRSGLVLVVPGEDEEEEPLPNYLKIIADAVSPGTPVPGVLAATATGAPLSAVSLPCKSVQVFPTEGGDGDAFIGDAASQPNRIPGMPVTVAVDDVQKLWGRLNTGTGNIPWLAITSEEEE